MNKAKSILMQLADGQEAAGLNGAALSKELRDALACGARAIEFKQRVVSALNQTGQTAQSGAQPVADAPKEQKATQGNRSPSVPRRWSPDEDRNLLKEYHEQVPQHTHVVALVNTIAALHDRTPFAIAVRLHNQYHLLDKADLDAVRNAQQRPGSAPTPGAHSPASEPLNAPAEAAAPASEVVHASAPGQESSASASPKAADCEGSVSGSATMTEAPSTDDDIAWGTESSSAFMEDEPVSESVVTSTATEHGAQQSAQATDSASPEASASAGLDESAASEAVGGSPEGAETFGADPRQEAKQTDSFVESDAAPSATKAAKSVKFPEMQEPVQDGPDYASLLEMELAMAPESARSYAKFVLARLDEQPELRNGAITLLEGGERAKERLPHPLRMAMLQRIKMLPAKPAN